MYEKLFNDFVVLLGMPSGLKIEKIAPIKTQLSEAVLTSVMTATEIREMAGLPPLEAEAQSGGAADALATLSPLVATKVLDNMTAEEIRGLVGLKGAPSITRTEQVFSNEDRIYIELSNKGYYDDEVELISEKFLDYNPFDFQDIGAIDRQIIDTLLNEPKTTIEELAQIIGETPVEIQERIDRLVEEGLLEADGEEVEVTEEGEEAVEETTEKEKTELITVYKYVKRPDAPALKTESRDFCKRMVALSRDKSWTYEEINETRFPGGKGSGNNAQGTDVFTKRGGWYTNPNTGTRTPFCRHIWSSRTIKVKKDAK